ncbi:Reverse transcriptase domain [Sesbania bispinosa]|nr:Reverse transcriptase domain [Sesbania bispinosa]
MTNNWVFEEANLQTMVLGYLTDLYTDNFQGSMGIMEESDFPVLPQNMINSLEAISSAEKIKNIVFSIGNFKTPGPDGIHAFFYKSQWDTLGPLVGDLSHKVESPVRVIQFRPISLCNVRYKVITKLISNRLRDVMPFLIGPAQCSFVKGRQSIDNAIVLQELIHSLRSFKGPDGYMVLKIDIAKAYDRMCWSFIIDTIRKGGIPSSLVKVIEECISTPHTRVN